MSTNIEDEEAPQLIDVSPAPTRAPISVDDESAARVPITVVTGMIKDIIPNESLY